MAEDKTLFKSEEKMSSADAARLIAGIADGVSTGRVVLTNGDDVSLGIPEEVDLELEVEDGDKNGTTVRSLEVELKWKPVEE